MNDKSTKTDLEILREARELVAAGWTQGQFSGMKLQGRCFCAIGAVSMAARGLCYPGFADHKYAKLLGFESARLAYIWNDFSSRTQAEVLARFDEAIEREEQR